jgi:hypothetical protein
VFQSQAWSFLDAATVFVALLHAASLTSNSFIEAEGAVAHFCAVTLALLVLRYRLALLTLTTPSAPAPPLKAEAEIEAEGEAARCHSPIGGCEGPIPIAAALVLTLLSGAVRPVLHSGSSPSAPPVPPHHPRSLVTSHLPLALTYLLLARTLSVAGPSRHCPFHRLLHMTLLLQFVAVAALWALDHASVDTCQAVLVGDLLRLLKHTVLPRAVYSLALASVGVVVACAATGVVAAEAGDIAAAGNLIERSSKPSVPSQVKWSAELDRSGSRNRGRWMEMNGWRSTVGDGWGSMGGQRGSIEGWIDCSRSKERIDRTEYMSPSAAWGEVEEEKRAGVQRTLNTMGAVAWGAAGISGALIGVLAMLMGRPIGGGVALFGTAQTVALALALDRSSEVMPSGGHVAVPGGRGMERQVGKQNETKINN